MNSILNFTVRYAETDQMGVMNYARYLDWLSEGRVNWLKEKGIMYSNWEKQNILLPVIDLKVRYHKSLYFQEEAVLETKLTTGKAKELVFNYLLKRNGELCLRAETRHFFIINGKVSRLTKDLCNLLGLE